ncbi:T6SS phospholipase effector Tle1-like catalytic domain-containing protein [Chromobacterium amazonense]|uniref:T6SS phospholipase effector Tle1-like catalytic domain-containing protein n=2 Tax=Chromobacterium amazonense TaxID=1382803 RepID=UPI0009F1BA00|nr:DUF2235 domain-containing protein [Chromobacterium amazonense]
MSTNNPAPYPTGQRALSAREQLQRAQALSCVNGAQQAKCQGQVHLALFFDGTGNNINLDYYQAPAGKQKPSNIARLFLAARDKPQDGYFASYMPGVGTPFPEIGDTGGLAGLAGGQGGEARILWALTRLLNAPHRYATGGALLLDDGMAKNVCDTASGGFGGVVRKLIMRNWQQKLQAALKGRKPEVTQINLSVFGFSRGATEARAFVNWLYQLCKEENGGWTFAGIPLRTQFLGIFDTVASVGNAQALPGRLPFTGHMAWADGNLAIHPAVEQCVHFVAGHEVRACFPLDSVRHGNAYPGNALEVMYPGSHSDVGGGYAAGELGVSLAQDSQMCVIPGRRMYDAARQAGVPLRTWDQLTDNVQKLLTPSPQAIKDFNAYLRDAKVAPGPVEKMHEQHMALYLSHRFKYRRTFSQHQPYRTANATDKAGLKATQDSLLKSLGRLYAGDPMAADFDPQRAAVRKDQNYGRVLLPAEGGTRETTPRIVAAQLDLRRLTPAIEHFLENYIHDSMAGFMGGAEAYLNSGLLKFRTVFKGEE